MEIAASFSSFCFSFNSKLYVLDNTTKILLVFLLYGDRCRTEQMEVRKSFNSYFNCPWDRFTTI